jgi:transcriptional regulator with XRE-family HTH domain
VSGGRQGMPGFDRDRLRQLRHVAGKTQAQLAEAADLHEVALAAYETGKRVPQVDSVAALARALGVSPLELTDRDDQADLTLAHLRHAAGLSQEETATRAGMVRTRYSMLERGETVTLSATDAAKLADALGTDIDDVRTAHAAGRATYVQRRLHGGRPSD